MKIFKIALFSLFLICISIAFVSATSIDEFKSPQGFDEGIGESMDYEDFSIVLDDYDSEMDENPFKGDAFHQINIKGKIAEFNDTFNDEVGSMELIKIGKTNYIVKCIYHDTDSSKIKNCTKYLKEFNKVNDLEPEKINI